MQNTLIIFIKNPIIGKVKTRIANDVGADVALKIYKDLLVKTQSEAGKVAAKCRLYYSDFIDKDDEWSNSKFDKHLQSDGNIGKRMEEAFRGVSEKTILIGSDCFDLTSNQIEEAFQQLNKVDLVLGPANDGGYYLIGMNNFHPNLFHGINWSTEKVLAQTVEIAKHQKLSIAFLKELVDLDTFSDIKKSTYKLNQLDGK